MTISALVMRLICDHFGVDADKVTPKAHHGRDLDIDSLETVELHMALEEELSIQIGDAEAEEMQTVQDVVRVVERLLASEGAVA